MESEKERLRLNIEACEVLVDHSMETLAQDLRKLKMLIDSKENLLNEVMDFHDFKKQLSDLESWMERTSKRTQAYMNDVTETVSRKHVHGELSSEIESRRQYVTELHLKKQNDFHCFTKDNLDVLTNCWCSFERKWHALQSQVRMLGDLVENTDGLNHILNDFDAIESWLDEQEKKIYLEPSNKLNDSLDESGFENGFLENALSNQNELEEFLKIQDEKVRLTCDKIDSFKMVKTGDNDSTDMTFSSEVHIVEKLLQLENQVEDAPSNGGLDDSETNNHSNEINNNETTGADSLRDIPQTSPLKPDKVLIGLLKKSRTSSNSKKRVVFSTTHEFSDCVTIQQFSKLNDEYEQEQHYFYEDDDDDYDNYADGNYANYVDDDHWEDDGIVFSEEALSPSYYPEPPEEFLHLSDSDEDEDDDCWDKDYFLASTTTSPRDEEVESPNIFDFPTSPNKANDDDEQEQQSNENSSSSNQLTFLNYEEEVESDVYFTDSEDEGDVLP